jgi:hypothetical protein
MYLVQGIIMAITTASSVVSFGSDQSIYLAFNVRFENLYTGNREVGAGSREPGTGVPTGLNISPSHK